MEATRGGGPSVCPERRSADRDDCAVPRTRALPVRSPAPGTVARRRPPAARRALRVPLCGQITSACRDAAEVGPGRCEGRSGAGRRLWAGWRRGVFGGCQLALARGRSGDSGDRDPSPGGRQRGHAMTTRSDRRNTRTCKIGLGSGTHLSYSAGQEGSGQRCPRVLLCFQPRSARLRGPYEAVPQTPRQGREVPPSQGPRRNQTSWASEAGRTASRRGCNTPRTG